jgi:hypothetical protein
LANIGGATDVAFGFLQQPAESCGAGDLSPNNAGRISLQSMAVRRMASSEQFPTASRGRGQYFGESCGRVAAGVVAPFLLEHYTGSPTILFGTLAVIASIGAFVPVLFGKETVGQLETVSERTPRLA